MFHAINDVIHVRTLWSQKVVLTKLDGLPHVFPKMQFTLHFVQIL